MDSNFGDYITKEYGLLKQILSYLKPCDLHNARSVCRDWRKAVDNLVDKKPLSISYKHGEKNLMPYVTKPILPHILIYQNVLCDEFVKPDKCTVCKQNLLKCFCDLAGPETTVILLNNLPVYSSYDSELYSFWQLPSALLLSSPENIISNTLNSKDKKNLTKILSNENLTDKNDTIKGIFVFSTCRSRGAATNLLDEIVIRQGPTFAVGGGLAEKIFYYNGESKKYNKSGVNYIIFKGDNVSAHCELITGRCEKRIEKAMERLKERAGEVPDGSTRIAFIAQCVDRRSEILEKMESSLFRKYFPNVPQIGFPALGEFGIKSGCSENCPRNLSKRKKLEFFHAYTTSILIITLRKP